MNELGVQIEALRNKLVDHKWIDVDEGWYQLVIDCDKELTAIDPQLSGFPN